MSEAPINNKGRKPTPKKEFSLADYKKSSGLDKAVKFKPRRWLPIKNVLGGTAFMQATGFNKGLPLGECIQCQGHTDSGKTSLLFEVAYSCQQNNILPVFIITELKFSWDYLKNMGVQFDEVVDETTGEISYEGNFLFIDRSKFNTIEEMGAKINEILDDQESGKLPMDLMFLIDSIGSIPCEMSYTKKTSNSEWDAGSVSKIFGKTIMPRINLSKKDGFPYYNTMIIITQVWVSKPATYGALPRLESKGGTTIPFNSAIQITFGNVSNSGTSKLKIKKDSKEIVVATRTRVNLSKNHVTGISLVTKLVVTPHGFIMDSEKDAVAKQYFKDHSDFFIAALGGGNPDEVEFFVDNSEENEDFSRYNNTTSTEFE